MIGYSDSACYPEQDHLIFPPIVRLDDPPYRRVELSLRVKQATRYLSAVREAVAEKSFQYSHVMRGTHSKDIRTRSRAVIGKASDRISHYCRVYTRARAAMVRLGADEHTLKTFQVLSREDVKASTAILDPNITGSSTIQLSWIWEMKGKAAGSTPDAMRECMSRCRVGHRGLSLIIFKFSVFIGFGPEHRRIDGKKSCCSLNMRCNGRQEDFCTSPSNGRIDIKCRNTDSGPKAYAARQSSQWRYMALEADQLFRSANSVYKNLV